jgi:hypothetical protein
MRYSNYIGILAGLLMLLAARFTWIYIPTINATVNGFGSETVTKFGMPVMMNMVMLGLAFLCFLVPRLWAKRINPFVCAINFAWALRNLLLLSTCRNGECPEPTVWLYVYFVGSIIVLVMALLPDLKVVEKK